MTLRHSIARALYAGVRDHAPRLRGRKRIAHVAARLLAAGDPIIVESYGLTFALDLRDHVEEEIFWEDYDRETVAWWRQQIRASDVVFDVGANVGVYTLTAAARGAHVVAFEPNQRTQLKLVANVRHNVGLAGRVTIRSEALCDEVGTASLFVDVNEGKFGANAGVASLSNRNAGGRADVVVTSKIDVVLVELGLKRLDWIKMDIQGAELAALRGGVESLRKFRPRLVLEIDANASVNMGWTAADLERFCAEMGYRLRRLDSLNVVAEPA